MKNSFLNTHQFRSWFSLHKISLFWYRWYRRAFLVLFVVISALGAWYWYYNLYQYSWNEETKKTFLDSHAQETDLKEAIFKKEISAMQERQKRYESGVSLEHDFFRLERLPEETK
ncbi:MAG: hypothetical protein KBC83_03905 [Candidatus Moranbacteria bacterium]|nr:hypothetical protein [Candidatus Moranbacteria bacterium]MBP9801778.1 hypothetical protein [Candidatus Moranbacteria bacterium]